MNNSYKDKDTGQEDSEGVESETDKKEKKEIVHSPLAEFLSFGWLTALQYTKVPEDRFKATLLKALLTILLTIVFLGLCVLSFILLH